MKQLWIASAMLAADARKGKTTIVNALAELDRQDLLHRSRGGSGYANKLYLRMPETCTSECRKPEPQNAGKPAPNKNNKKNNKKNNQSYYNSDTYFYKGDSL